MYHKLGNSYLKKISLDDFYGKPPLTMLGNVIKLRVARTAYENVSTDENFQIYEIYLPHAGFTISPGNNWVLEVEREYEITVHIFDKINHRVIVTEVYTCIVCSVSFLESDLIADISNFVQNVPLETELPTGHLLSHFSSTNGSYHHIKAVKMGVASISSTLRHVKV